VRKRLAESRGEGSATWRVEIQVKVEILIALHVHQLAADAKGELYDAPGRLRILFLVEKLDAFALQIHNNLPAMERLCQFQHHVG